jgi:hypothetical protein
MKTLDSLHKNNKQIGTAIALLLLISTIAGCKKFIEVPAPNTQLVTASVFSNNASATSAMTDIYTQMFANGESFNMAYDNGLLSDELVTPPPFNPGDGYVFYINSMGASTLYFGPWQHAYNYIYQANSVISGLQQYHGTSPAVKQQLTGEAYFIRAFWHFYLTDCYGAIPLVTTTDYTIVERLSRTPRLQVIQQVIADLQAAQGLLSNNYVDASDTSTTTDRVRPTKAVAAALLARAYLYLGDYDNHNATDYRNSEVAAGSVINNSSYSLCTNLSGANSVFLKNSAEAIWQLYTPLPASYNTPDGQGFILLAAPIVYAGSNSNNATISLQLMNAFEPGDQRLTNWIGSITEGTTTYYFPYKYKTYSYDGTEYTMMLRLGEQYLIRAEAEAEQDETGSAVADLNKIRNRAGLPNYAGATDKSSLLTAILHERQVELFTEWGHRWLDLQRTGNCNAVMSVVTPQKGGTWNPDGYQQLYPISLSDLRLDNNLTQNPGY